MRVSIRSVCCLYSEVWLYMYYGWLLFFFVRIYLLGMEVFFMTFMASWLVRRKKGGED